MQLAAGGLPTRRILCRDDTPHLRALPRRRRILQGPPPLLSYHSSDSSATPQTFCIQDKKDVAREGQGAATLFCTFPSFLPAACAGDVALFSGRTSSLIGKTFEHSAWTSDCFDDNSRWAGWRFGWQQPPLPPPCLTGTTRNRVRPQHGAPLPAPKHDMWWVRLPGLHRHAWRRPPAPPPALLPFVLLRAGRPPGTPCLLTVARLRRRAARWRKMTETSGVPQRYSRLEHDSRTRCEWWRRA